MHISFKIIKFYFTLRCSTCFGHHRVHHQELLIAALAVSGHRVVLGRLFPPALFCSYCCFQLGFYSVLSLMMHGTMNVKQIMIFFIIQFFPHYLHVTGRMEPVLLAACCTVAKPSYTASCIPHFSFVNSAKFQLRVSMFAARTLTRLQYEVKSVSTASPHFLLQFNRLLPGMLNLL
jgi:hypothetical protein